MLPVSQFLFATGLHGCAMAIVLLGYLLTLIGSIRRKEWPQPFFDNDGHVISVLEWALALLGVIQIGLGLLGELWFAAFGLLASSSNRLANCSRNAPVLFKHAVGVSMYENWLLVVCIVVVLTVVCGGRSLQSVAPLQSPLALWTARSRSRMKYVALAADDEL